MFKIKKKTVLIVALLSFCFLNINYSQNNLKSVNDSISKYLFNNAGRAKFFSHKLLSIAKAEKNNKEISMAYYFLAELCGTVSQKDSVFYYFDKAIQTAIQSNASDLELYHKINRSNYLFSEFDFDGALSSYNECLDLAQKLSNQKMYDYVLIRKGDIYYELGKYNESLAILKKGLKRNDFDVVILLGIQLSLSKVYLKLDDPNIALEHTKKGVQISKKEKLDEYEMHFYNQQGLIYIYKNDYSSAKLALEKALALARKGGIVEMERAIKINISKIFTFQKEAEQAIVYLNEIIKNKEKVSISAVLLAETYYLLAENHKELNNFKESNFYFKKYVDEEKKLGQKKIETIDHMHKYDVSEIENQKKDLLKQRLFLAVMVGLCIVIALFFLYKKRIKDKENQEKFDSLIQKVSEYENKAAPEKSHKILEDLRSNIDMTSLAEKDILSEDQLHQDELSEEVQEEFFATDHEHEYMDYEEVTANETTQNAFIIKDEKVNEILEKLIKLEEKQYFLKQECTLHSVAKKLKTNTAYLSKIVNNELGKSFSTYINELRINYIIIELKNNAKLRSYSVNAIAIEIGYKRPEAFTKYFKEATGISPTIYIKKINKMLEK